MSEYEAKQEARRERLEARAAKAAGESQAAFARSQSATAGIPPGQPVLVGHHSERHHRKALERSDNAMRKSVEASKDAAELARRADAVGTAGISSDDPDATSKLREKLVELEAKRDHMKAANKAFKKAGGSGKGLVACIEAGLLDSKQASEISRVTFGLCGHDRPYPPYEISNIGARIRDVGKRIEAIEKRDATPPHEALIIGEVRIEENVDENRCQIFFPADPGEATKTELSRWGFHWSRTNQAWQRMRSNQAWYWAERIVRAEKERG